MDDKDKEIIKLLMENSRIPYTEIAKKLGVTEATIRKRISELEKDKVILKYTIEVDPEKLGYKAVSILGLDAEPKYLLEVAKKIAEYDEVRWVSTSTGDHMIMCEVWARDGEDLFQFITQKIGKIRGIKDICPAILLERIK